MLTSAAVNASRERRDSGARLCSERAFAISSPPIHLVRMSALEIQQMSRPEKLKLMETLWADLSGDDLESPAWHADALHETSERRARGVETVLDWEQAKAKLRQGR
jgi:hypothetical protein